MADPKELITNWMRAHHAALVARRLDSPIEQYEFIQDIVDAEVALFECVSGKSELLPAGEALGFPATPPSHKLAECDSKRHSTVPADTGKPLRPGAKRKQRSIF